QNNSTYTFGTYLKDEEGKMAKAVLGQSTVYNSTSYYTIKTLQKDGDDLKIFPAYTAGLVNYKTKSSYPSYSSYWTAGNSNFKVDTATGYIKYVDNDGDGEEYYVLDTRYLPTGTNFPVGTIEWDNLSYDFDGFTGSSKVGFTYQWGFSAAERGSINVNFVNYKMRSISRVYRGTSDTAGTKVDVVEESDGWTTTYTSTLTLDPMTFDASMIASGKTQFSLIDYINSFTRVNGNSTAATNSAMNGYSVKWDLTELQNELNKHKTENGEIKYYEGFKATVTAYVGGDVLKVSDSYFKGSNYSNNSKYASSGCVAVAVPVTIVVSSYEFRELGTTVTFDPYSAGELTGEALFSDGTRINASVKALEGGRVTKALYVGSTVSVEAPFILTGALGNYKYQKANLKDGDLSYNGLAEDIKKNIYYACFTIGTEYSGKQVVYLPITIRTLSASQVQVTVAHEDTFNPYWFERDAYTSFDVTFTGVGRHTM
ncbi:MAG: hypothetical protein K2N18_02940, partial [Clostridia bacterium]|nr:hypothetical protein [Clostridia bacterium]